MTDNNTIEIELSKKKLVKLLVFSIVFLAAGLWMVITKPQTSNPIFNHIIVKGLASYGSIIMGLSGIYFFTKKLIQPEMGLIINENGIQDNSSAFNIGLIPWHDIIKIYRNSIQTSFFSKQHFIIVEVDNVETYMAQQNSIIQRKLVALNTQNGILRLSISTNSLKIEHDALVRLMIDAFYQYKTNIDDDSF